MDEDDKTNGADRDELLPPLAWPNADHSLTKHDGNWTLNSCIKGWSMDGAATRIIGYRAAADLIFRRLADDWGGRNTLVYPLAFLWRHAIELQLKNIIDRGQIVLEQEAVYPKHHDLKKIWEMAVEVIEKLQADDSGERENVTRVIDELCALDPDSAGFR